MARSRNIAVLTGDIVASSALSRNELEQAIKALTLETAMAEAWAADTSILGAGFFARTRGDGWQFALLHPAYDLRAALMMRAALSATLPGVATRIAIGRGPGELAGGDLNAASGPAFTRSGQALGALGAPALMVHASGGALAATVRLADHISQGWTQAQARAILPMLEPKPPTRKVVAKTRGISPQAVGQALDAAGYGAISAALALYEQEGTAA